MYSSEYILDTIANVTNDIEMSGDSDEDSVHHFERVLDKYSNKLHPHHYILVEIKQKLAQIYGNFAPYTLLTMSRPLKERKIQVQDVYNKIN